MLSIPNILTIAGSDSGGGAGIQADIKTIMALGGYGMTAITALTAQNGLGVTGIEPAAPEFVALQINTIINGFPVASGKTGMLFSAEIIEVISEVLKNCSFPLVVDPVCVSQSGSKLLEDSAIGAMIDKILPLSTLLTPNCPEARMLTGIKVDSARTAEMAAKKLVDMGAKAVLIKGGHLDSTVMVTDYLYIPGREIKEMPQPKVDTDNNHGTGCTLSAAIATFLGFRLPVEVAVAKAQRYLNLALRKSYAPGKGAGPVNHAVTI